LEHPDELRETGIPKLIERTNEHDAEIGHEELAEIKARMQAAAPSSVPDETINCLLLISLPP
jgi:hypothetical protein